MIFIYARIFIKAAVYFKCTFNIFIQRFLIALYRQQIMAFLIKYQVNDLSLCPHGIYGDNRLFNVNLRQDSRDGCYLIRDIQ